MEKECLKYAADMITDGLWDWNFNTRQVFYSKQWKEMLGFTDSEIGESTEEWSTRVHPEDLQETINLVDNYIKGLTDIFSSEHRMRCKDGRYRWVLSEGKIVSRDSDGKPIRIVGIQKDITKLKNTEFTLEERVKELNCHNRISEIMNNSNLDIDEVIDKIVHLIPDSWQFPGMAQAAITVYDKIYKTVDFQPSKITLIQEIKVNEKFIGKVEVIYPESSQFPATLVFQPEESVLLFTIAVRVGNYIEKSEKNFALQKSEERYRNIIENINDVIFEIDAQGIVTFISSPIIKIFEYSAEEIRGKNFTQFVGENGQLLLKRLIELSEKIELRNEYQIHTKTGESRWIQMSTRAIFSDGIFKGGTGTIINITQRKLTEIELQKSESLYGSVLNASPDAITITDLDGIILYSSPRILKMFRYADTNSIINRSLFDFIDLSDHQRAQSNIEKLFQGTLLRAEEYTGIRSDSTLFDIEVNAEFIRDPEGNRTSMLFVTRDISDRKQAEEKLRKSEEKYRNLVERLNDVIYEITDESVIKYVSPSIEQIVGYTHEELIGRNIFEFIHPDDIPQVAEALSDLGSSNIPYLEYRYLTKSGSISWVHTSTTPSYENGRVIGGTGSLTDITERKMAEVKIEKLNRLYSVISHASQAIVHIRDKSELMNEVCRIGIEFGKFRMAWIGLIDEEAYLVRPVAKAGVEEGYLSVISQISVSDIPEGRGPTGSAIRKGDHYVCDNIETDPMVAPWRNEAIKRGYRSSIALPLRQSGKIVGAFTLYSSQPYFFDQEEVRLLDEFVNEISFAFETIEIENERKKAEEQLRKLSRAVEQSPVNIVIADLEGNIEYANPKASATTGYTFEELIGKNPRVLKSGETPDNEYQKLWEDITSGKQWHGTFHNKRKNGELYWESSTISPITDNLGKITHFLAVKEDITQQKLAELELRHSEERYKALFENNHTVMMVIDPETGQIKSVNPAACQYYGWSYSELCAKMIWEINGIDSDELKAQMRKALNLQVNQFHFKHKLRNGEIRDVEVFSNPVQIGESKLLFAIVNDITKRKLAEQEILKFRTIADQANYGSAITSLNGNLLYINNAFAWMHGYEPDELLGKKLTTFHNQEQLPLVTELIDQLKITGSFSTQEVWHTRRDGTEFPTLMNAVLIYDSKNVPQFLSATAIDISELKQRELELQRSENELNKAQELARMGSWEFNLVSNELVGSKNYYGMLGLEQVEASVNLFDYFLSIVHPHDLPLIDFLQNHQYAEHEMQVVDIRIQHPQEGIRWLQNNVQPVFQNGRLVALKGVNIDITEKKKILEDLIKAKEQAEESDKLKTSFLNNISHEIRTPFNGILGFLSMFQFDDLTTEERNEYIEMINQSAERLMNTINDIVEISQIQSGQTKLDLCPVDIKKIILDLETHFRREIEVKGLDFNITINLDQSINHVLTDPHKLTTILAHLLGNAVKFTKSGRIDVTIQTKGVIIEFIIKDTGVGIAKNRQQFIFEHFRQADSSNTRQFEGSGLGLTIAKAYAEMLHGKIWVESQEGEGSSFYLSIPPYEIPETNALAQIIQTEGKPEFQARKLKILIAEDDESSAIFISIVIKSFGKQIIIVRTGTEAVEACLNNPDIDLILMDIQMPEMDGYEATRQIRKFNSEVVIVAQTAYALSGDDEKTITAGCNDYLTKPIRKEQLVALIQKYFQEE